MRRLLHYIRAFLFGDCPKCHSLHIRMIPGWDKMECLECGYCWRSGLL